jgi:hypothetical protein
LANERDRTTEAEKAKAQKVQRKFLHAPRSGTVVVDISNSFKKAVVSGSKRRDRTGQGAFPVAGRTA